jgi:hypothetical protein
LSPKAPKYFILKILKRSLILAYGPTMARNEGQSAKCIAGAKIR